MVVNNCECREKEESELNPELFILRAIITNKN